MDTERMKRVMERVYGAKNEAAPENADALRELLRLESAAAALLRVLSRQSRACMDALAGAIRRSDARRRALETEFFLQYGTRAPDFRAAAAAGVLSGLRQLLWLSRARARLYEGENALPIEPETKRGFAAECRAEEAAVRRLLAFSQK